MTWKRMGAAIAEGMRLITRGLRRIVSEAHHKWFGLAKYTRSRFSRRLIVFAWSVVGLLALGLLILCQRVDARSRVDGARRSDAIIVLGSAVWADERPSPSLYARAQHAIELYRAGEAAHLILCGGLGKNPPSEAEAMRRIAMNAGVPAEALVLEDRSHSTEENLTNAKALMDAHGWRTAIIVSDPFHLMRAEMMAHDLGIEAYGSGANASPTYTSAPMRMWYTFREAIALVWYSVSQTIGEPTWLYGILKGKI
jgi:uncharacterized SAM-binding protein YcdF (DUF218 family)